MSDPATREALRARFAEWWELNWAGKYPETDARDRMVAEQAYVSALLEAQARLLAVPLPDDVAELLREARAAHFSSFFSVGEKQLLSIIGRLAKALEHYAAAVPGPTREELGHELYLSMRYVDWANQPGSVKEQWLKAADHLSARFGPAICKETTGLGSRADATKPDALDTFLHNPRAFGPEPIPSSPCPEEGERP